MAVDKNSTSFVIIVVVIVFVVLGGVYLGSRLFTQNKGTDTRLNEEAKPDLKRMANLPPKEELIPLPPTPKYEPDAPVLEQARKALRDSIGPTEAYEMAQSLPDSPERADAAFLLLEYAAEAGHTLAALKIAGYYDPTNTNPSGTIRKNPAIALEWYQTAIEGGQPEAKNDLEQLRGWVNKKAEQGNQEARELLKSWDSHY